jgi:hypothetical protein
MRVNDLQWADDSMKIYPQVAILLQFMTSFFHVTRQARRMLDIWFTSYQEGQMYADMRSLLQSFYMVVKYYNVLPWGKNINYKYLKTSLTLHGTEFRKWQASSQSRNFAYFIESKVPLTCFRQTGHDRISDESCPHPHVLLQDPF